MCVCVLEQYQISTGVYCTRLPPVSGRGRRYGRRVLRRGRSSVNVVCGQPGRRSRDVSGPELSTASSRRPAADRAARPRHRRVALLPVPVCAFDRRAANRIPGTYIINVMDAGVPRSA